MDALKNAAAALARTLRGTAGVAATTVTYRRGDDEVELPATRASPGALVDSGDVVISGITDDWVVNAADLAFDGDPITAAPNDEIEDDAGVKYRVSQNHPDGCFRYCDGSRLMIRIHTTRV